MIIFDKLDEHRGKAHIIFIWWDELKNFGQNYLFSDTHADRTENVVANIHQSYRIFKLWDLKKLE